MSKRVSGPTRIGNVSSAAPRRTTSFSKSSESWRQGASRFSCFAWQVGMGCGLLSCCDAPWWCWRVVCLGTEICLWWIGKLRLVSSWFTAAAGLRGYDPSCNSHTGPSESRTCPGSRGKTFRGGQTHGIHKCRRNGPSPRSLSGTIRLSKAKSNGKFDNPSIIRSIVVSCLEPFAAMT